MNSLTGSLTKHFIIAGLLPALVFTVINRILLAAVLPDQIQETIGKLLSPLFSELEGVSYVLIPVVIAAVLMSCNTVLVRLYEGYYFRDFPWLLGRQRARWKQTYGRLTELQAKLEEMEASAQNCDVSEAKLRHGSVVRAISNEKARVWGPNGKAWDIPYEEQRLMPTRLGNAFAMIEEHPSRCYGMDAVLYWPHMLLVIPEKYNNEIGNLKMSIDFALNLSTLFYVMGIESVAAAIILRNWHFLIGTTIALILGYLLYCSAVIWTQEMGALVASCFDLFRADLKKVMTTDSRSDLEVERATWLSLAQFFVTADSRHLSQQDHQSMESDSKGVGQE